MSLFDEWQKEFEPKLKQFNRRWEGFSYIAKHLLEIKTPKIVEVGCIRTVDGWGSDGQSTRVWEWIAEKAGGFVYSIDRDKDHLDIAKRECPTIETFLSDGIFALAHSSANNKNIDFLFLDGMDFLGGDLPPRAWLQHAGFLAACWDDLKSGCIIAIDDCMDDQNGKHLYVKKFFEDMNIKPVVSEYIHVWIKP